MQKIKTKIDQKQGSNKEKRENKAEMLYKMM